MPDITHVVSSESAWATAGGNVTQTTDGATTAGFYMSRVERGWVEWDLGSVETLSQLRLHMPAGNSDDYMSLWVSEDQKTWTEVVAPANIGGSGGWYEYDFVEIDARYIMFVHHSALGGGGDIYINEFEAVWLATRPAGTGTRRRWRQLREGTQTASSTGAGNPAWTWQMHRFDGNAGGEWESSGAAAGAWLAMDLGAAEDITGCVFTTDRGPGVSFQLQSSDNGSTWTNRGSAVVGDFDGDGEKTISIGSTVSARYWRLLGANPSGSDAMQVGSWFLTAPAESYSDAGGPAAHPGTMDHYFGSGNYQRSTTWHVENLFDSGFWTSPQYDTDNAEQDETAWVIFKYDSAVSINQVDWVWNGSFYFSDAVAVYASHSGDWDDWTLVHSGTGYNSAGAKSLDMSGQAVPSARLWLVRFTDFAYNRLEIDSITLTQGAGASVLTLPGSAWEYGYGPMLASPSITFGGTWDSSTAANLTDYPSTGNRAAIGGGQTVTYDYGSAVRATHFVFASSASNRMTAVTLQYSDNGTDWTDCGSYTDIAKSNLFGSGSIMQYRRVQEDGAHRYWRFVIDSSTSGAEFAYAAFHGGDAVDLYSAPGGGGPGYVIAASVASGRIRRYLPRGPRKPRLA